MQHFPIFLTLRDQPVLVVGGGERAARKLRLIARAGARVTVVAPETGAEIAAAAAAGRVVWHARTFQAADCTGQAIVFGATGADAVDRAVSAAARAAGLPVNVTDRPDLSSFIVPAIVDRDPIVIGISSGGSAPILARNIRAFLESHLPARLGALARFADSFRGAVKGSVANPDWRRRFWERFFNGPIAGLVLAGRDIEARERMIGLVNRAEGVRGFDQGMVHLVGAGPGDPDLLTFRALKVLQEADVVVYDRLVAPAIVDYARRDAERIDVGKAKGDHTIAQDDITRLLIARAAAGQKVVRLKGGDPMVFGRGGEELELLRRHGIRVEVVPGITAATGCLAAAGIPLTHRDLASTAALVTGHGRDGDPDLDWQALAGRRTTIVVYMGASVAGSIADRLIGHGLAGTTPVAVIENGTRADQRVAVGTLAELAGLVAGTSPAAPALIVIGEVARFAIPGEVADPALPVRAVGL